ncbi:MAG: D-tyrosyl-tRNA(Tyr) deacylase [Ignavibacteria bacterium RIFOXYB2_FULL_35_12]|nr:MAG: D-tyrosyl-tRNA(Tyr) deacylase [Ignavibacteria bacterium GWA2_36_19]OGU55131.1 MAG: D-tyrosyl-tRNA(Tyr) deacylase [Ignavibacteria bacterium GWC2_35_8]OGU59278.1 MAG: D-tyrosyl-tRNA(Tyr) deacylase [Ignavibacteria bacterium GWF2_35_20]OGU82277.1 MAG: D-tyrosyl-tRNA(Tyr) deacylase [Ignavibacteria bacterium RIFOXYA2_FULL_35_9]OGU86529.1 MAG: D-tyrosyl-tRNA(Tyr) deacylase [Ignavibacteria bacterium RIFOXYA12_FULL_35_25]OGU86889.1 MAG: D-tyrosyl-tRNA(Tyr) deacylase [Ignavibacteria bacterium RI
MKAVIQRVSSGSVLIKSENYEREIKKGFVILLGIRNGDSENDSIFLADKCSNLRVFEDKEERMNLSLKDVDGEVLVISQFTLYGDAQRGNRPSFIEAAKPDIAIPLYEKFIQKMKVNLGDEKVKEGIFGAMMEVKIINDGPVTIIIDSK